LGHPKLKNFLALSMVTEGVPKKCGKQDKGKVSMLEAKLKAEQEFEKFRVIQDKVYESDFDKEVKKINAKAITDKKKKEN